MWFTEAISALNSPPFCGHHGGFPRDPRGWWSALIPGDTDAEGVRGVMSAFLPAKLSSSAGWKWQLASLPRGETFKHPDSLVHLRIF